MSGSSINLEHIRSRHPSEAESIGRLEGVLATALSHASGPRYRWTLDRFCDLVEPRSRDELALILGELVARGLLDREIQVESPSSHEVIARFHDLKDVPDEIQDTSRDIRIPVSADTLRFIYAQPRRA